MRIKQIICLILLLLLPTFVYAEDNNIALKSITLQEKSETCEEQTPASTDNNDINIDLKMGQVGDYATYKIKIKNNSNNDLVITTTQSTNSDYLQYTILENNTTIKKSEEKELTLRVEYITKAEQSVLINGELEQALDLTITAEKPVNPKTGTIMIILLFIISVVIFIIIRPKKSVSISLIITAIIIPNIVLALNSSKITIHSKVLLVNIEYVYTVNIYDDNNTTLVNGTNTSVVWLNQTFPTTIEKFTTASAAMNKLSEVSGGETPFYLKHKLENNIVRESYVEFVVTEEMANANPGMNPGTYALRGEKTGTYDSNWYFTCYDEYYDSDNDMCVSPYYESNKEVIKQAFGSLWSNYCYIDSSSSDCSVLGLDVYVYVGGYVSAGKHPWYCNVDDASSTCYESGVM